MDYSPSPFRAKSQHGLLDNSIEAGRSEKPFKSSPLKNLSAVNKDDMSLHDMQRKFYNKYTDLKPQDFNAMKPSKVASDDSTDRLFKDVGTKVPLEDDVKISSNMIEKIIRENERLKHDKDLVQSFAKGLKEKLVKYKQLNDTMKEDLSRARENLKTADSTVNTWKTKYEELKEKYDSLITISSKGGDAPKSPEYHFNANNTRGIFGDIGTALNSSALQASGDSHARSQDEGVKNADLRIKYLEEIIANNGEQLESLKSEMKSLKTLLEQTDNAIPDQKNDQEISENQKKDYKGENEVKGKYLDPRALTEDHWVIRETFELNQLQTEVQLLHKKLAMREENIRKKSELKRELLELSVQLERADELPKKTKQASPKESPARYSTQDKEAEDKAAGYHSVCTRCLQAKKSTSSRVSLPSSPRSPDLADASRTARTQEGEEPKHFHINGVKWY